MNMKIIKIAFNNIFKQKRRTFFNLITFAANAVALITMIGMLNGMYNQAFERTIELDTGHFKIYNAKFLEEKAKLPIELNIKDPYTVIEEIKGIKYFVAAAPRITRHITVSDFKKKTSVMAIGIDMKAELVAMRTFEKLDPADRLPDAGGKILLGAKLASLMGVSKGDSMLIYGQTAYKANNLSDVEVQGLYSSGFEKMDKNIAFVPLSFFQDFLDIPGSATEIVVRIKERKYVKNVKSEIEKILAEKHPELKVRDWTEEAASLIAGAQMDYMSYSVLFAILLFLAVFIIMNTITITVFERTAEIGTLRAIGLEKQQVGWMFMWEGLMLSLGGAILGGLLAVPVAFYMNMKGIPMPAEFADMMPFPIESMTSKNTWFDWVLTTGICLVTGVIGAILPSMRAAGTNIVDALKKGVR